MTDKDVMKTLKKIGAVMTDDHFVLTSGRHTNSYIRKDRLYPHVDLTAKIARAMAEKAAGHKIEAVVGPALCGIVLSTWVAYYLSKIYKKRVLSLFTEKDYGTGQVFDVPQVFKRGYEAWVKGKRVLVVEDLTTTGGSVGKVVEQVRKAGGKVAAVCVMVNRNPGTVNRRMMGAPFYALADFAVADYEADKCPFCQMGRKINTEVGHGKEFLEKKGKQK